MAGMDFGSMINGIGATTGSIFQTILIVVAVIIVMVLVFGGLFLLYWTRKRYNLRVEIKKPRSDGKIILGEWGKGLFNSKKEESS